MCTLHMHFPILACIFVTLTFEKEGVVQENSTRLVDQEALLVHVRRKHQFRYYVREAVGCVGSMS